MGKNRKEGKGMGRILMGRQERNGGWMGKIGVDNAGIGRIGIGYMEGKKKNGE